MLKSSIPTLVLQGRYDTQTNATVGHQAMAGLSNGFYLEFPKSGHGVLVFSQCAKDVGAAFVNDPTQLPKADCPGGSEAQVCAANRSEVGHPNGIQPDIVAEPKAIAFLPNFFCGFCQFSQQTLLS